MVLWCSLECTPPCQGGGRGFKSRQDRRKPSGFHPGRVAQLVERAPEKREVTGSTPVPATLRQSRRMAPPTTAGGATPSEFLVLFDLVEELANL